MSSKRLLRSLSLNVTRRSYHTKNSRPQIYCVPQTILSPSPSSSPCYNVTTKRYYEGHTYWNQRWSDGTTIWHKFDIDPMLKKHYDFISSGQNVFVSLCGKSLDMKWLAKRGHSVVGCDIVELAAVQFFNENNISYKKYTIDHFTVYESTIEGLQIKLLVGDILHCTVESIGGEVDSIWDCNALVAISPRHRDSYMTTLVSLLKPAGRILVSSYEFEQEEARDCPPYLVPPEIIKKLFESFKCDVSLKDTIDNSGQFCMKYQIPWADRHIYYVKKIS